MPAGACCRLCGSSKRYHVPRMSGRLRLGWILLGISFGALNVFHPGDAAAQRQVPDIRQPPPREGVAWTVLPRPSGADQVVSLLRFPSPVLTESPRNNTVEALVYRPRDAARPMPVAILLHFFGAVNLRFEERMAAELNRRGIAVAVLTLPYHLGRAQASGQSGLEALRPDPAFLARTVAQAVLDCRRLIDYIETQSDMDANRIATVGTSLGGILSSLVHAVDDRVVANASLLAGADLAHIIWTSTVTTQLRGQLQARGVNLEGLRAAMEPVEPLTHARSDLGERMLVVRALYDDVILPEDTDKLIEAFDVAHVVALPTGHYGGALLEARLYRLVGDFLSSEFRGLSFSAPDAILGPTIRIGLQYNPATELSLVAGMDLYRVGKRPELFASAFLSTEGVLFFVGRPIAHGFAVGVTYAPGGFTWGVAWTFVL